MGNPQSLNRYSYVYNNPIRYNDPSGHCPLCVVVVIGGAGYTLGVVEIGVFAISATLIINNMLPGAQERNDAFANNVYSLGQQAAQGLSTLFAKKSDVGWADHLEDKYNLNRKKGLRRILHDEITKQKLTKEEIEDEAAEIERLNNKRQSRNQPKEQKEKGK